MKVTKNSLALVKLCCGVLADKKAGDLRVLDISEQSSITDYLVLATGTAEPHLRALRVELEKALDSSHAHIVGIETAQDSGWTVVDTFDVMIHLFTPENRAKYRLESLWKDAVEVSVPTLLAVPKPKREKATGKRQPVPRKKKTRASKK